MLREVANISQFPGEGPRRCFAEAHMHLLVWYEDDGSIHGFELTYESPKGPRAVRWQPDAGLSHAYVHDRETHRFMDASAVLVPCREPVGAEVLKNFHASAEEVPNTVRDFVADKLSAPVETRSR